MLDIELNLGLSDTVKLYLLVGLVLLGVWVVVGVVYKCCRIYRLVVPISEV